MAAHGYCRGSDPFRVMISHRCGTRVSASALFMVNLISATSTTKLYFLMVSANVASRYRIGILLDALVVSRAFRLVHQLSTDGYALSLWRCEAP